VETKLHVGLVTGDVGWSWMHSARKLQSACVSALSVAMLQWFDCHLNIPADKGTLVARSRSVCCLFHCHRARVYQSLSGRQLRQ
jgi:hypothetical protein